MVDFNKEAKNWDQNPIRIERAKVLASEIVKMIPISKKMRALEYGAGTGLVSFNLSEYFKEIVLMDSSHGMTEESSKKIKGLKISNINSITYDLLGDEKFKEKFDLIYTLLTLHHIIDTKKILSKLYALLENEGYLCIADLMTEDGSFHHKLPDFTGHNGFKIDELTEVLRMIGFRNFKHKIFYTIEKTVNNQVRKYPLFILIAQK